VVETAGVREDVRPASHESVDSDPVGGACRSWLDRFTGRRVVLAALVLVVASLLLRGWVAGSGYFRQDDLIATGRAARFPVLSSEFLLYDHDGHFMPLGFLLTGLYTRLAPLEWWPMAVTLVVLQALASLAVLRLLRLLLGDRPLLLLPLALYLFSPLTLPAFAWWIASLNALPLQAGLAWVAGDAIRLLRTGRRRYAVTGTVVFALTLFSFEKALVVPVVAFAVAVVLLRHAGESFPIVTAARRCLWLWTGLLVVTGAWLWVYSSVVGSPVVDDAGSGTVATAVEMVRSGVLEGLLPALLGGPLSWAEPVLYAAPPTAMVVAGCVVVAGAVVWASWRRRGCGVVWWMVAAYVAASAGAMVLGRLSLAAPAQLGLSLRYFSDTVVVVVIAVALVAIAPRRTEVRRRELINRTERRDVAVVALAAFLAASVWSTVTFTRAWDDNPTEAYLTTARVSLAETADVPMLDHGVPNDVLWAPAFPDNLVSRVFAPLSERPEFARATPELRMLDGSGALVDAEVSRLRELWAGPTENCGHAVRGRRATDILLNGPLVAWEWTMQLNYLAGGDGVLDVWLDGEPTRVPVERGPNTVFVRVRGGGEELHVRTRTPDLGVCIDSGLVGLVEPVAAD
jgi:hypothetical protein